MKLKNLCRGLSLVGLLLLTTHAWGGPPAQGGSAKKSGGFVEIGEGADDGAADSSTEDTAAKPALKDNEQVLSGTVRVMRKNGLTEVFFKDLPESYFVPSGVGYSSLYKSLAESEKKGTAVSFKVNTKSRRILSLEDSASSTDGKAAAPSKSANGGTSGSK
jgi:hypothetical protein